MEDDASSSSSGVESSPSEGEYILPDIDVPCFDLSGWDPEVSGGVAFLSLIPLGSNGYEVGNQQSEHRGKVKVSATHRKTRRREFSRGATIGRDIHDEKRLRQAVNEDDYSSAQQLLESGVDPSASDDKQRTPLHFAAAKGNETMVNLLLDCGANPNKKDTVGNTPLHLAACTSQIRVVTLLLKAGTDLQAIDNSGRTPLHVARSRLRLLHDNHSFNSNQLKSEVAQIVDMMREYLKLSGCHNDMDQLSELCQRLQNTSTREEMDEISGLLQDFTNLSLQRKESKPD